MKDTIQPIIVGIDFMEFSGSCLNFTDNFWHWASNPGQLYPLSRNALRDDFCANVGYEADEFSTSEDDIRQQVSEIDILTQEQKE